MSYIEQSLGSEEFVVGEAQIHWKVLLGPALLSVAFILPSCLVMAGGFTGLGLGMCFVGFLILVAAEKSRVDSAELIITNVRLIAKQGWVSTSTHELFMNRLEGVSVHKSFFGGLLGYGDVVVRGVGGSREVFRSIVHPLAFHRALQGQIDRTHGMILERPAAAQTLLPASRWQELDGR